MNWTGGGLSRHSSRKTGALTEKQKQYFSKVQTGAKKKSPQAWTILGHLVKEQNHRSQSIGTGRQHDIGRRSRDSSVSLLPRDSIAGPHIRRDRVRHFSVGSRHDSGVLDPVKIKQEFLEKPPNDLYDASPPRDRKRKRQSPVSKAEKKKRTISDMRKRLLQKGDWVGVTVRKPVQYKYEAPTYSNKFGQRRATVQQAQYSSRQMTIISPFAPRIRRDSTHESVSREHQPNGRTDVRISIGGTMKRPGISSSTAPSRRHTGPEHAQAFGSEAASSDVMLLDHEDSFSDSFQCRGQSIFNHAYSPSCNPGGKVSRSNIKSYQRPRTPHMHCRAVQRRDDGQQSEHVKRTHTQQSSEQSSPSNGHDECVIFSSSSVAVQHPKPQSSRRSILLEFSSSDLPDSIVAHVGKPKTAVLPSQIMDNKIWESWVGVLDGGDDDLEQSSERRVSPGVSEMATHQVNDNQDKSLLSTWLPIKLGIGGVIPSSPPEMITTTPQARSATSFDSSKEREFAELQHAYSAEIQSSLSRSIEANERMPLPQRPAPIQKPATPKQDADEVWKKFVFDDETDEDDEGSEESSRQVVAAVRAKSTVLCMQAPSSMAGNLSATDSTNSRQQAGAFRSRMAIKESSRRPQPSHERQQQNAWPRNGPLQRQFMSSSSDSAGASMVAIKNSSKSGPLPMKETRRVLFTKPTPIVGPKIEEPRSDPPLHTGQRLRSDANSFQRKDATLEDVVTSTDSDAASIEDD
ncbi:hypothetical protein BJ878DRAFT_200458 [Calycina marina]|uniref:Uncharacterized protein n=1 Tax=Calycina marina TaxID=1763456 RepID=A0A9P7ZBS0_9HELO|nr:hypothetical protein BJ878DRAFT_200458 [Calycina marina]